MKEYDSLISNTQKKNEFLKRYGEKQYETALDYYSKKADEELDTAYSTYQSALQQPKLSTLQRYGVEAQYDDTYEDKIRKIAGAAPASFDISKYITAPEGYTLPDTWDDQSADLALSAWKTRKDQEIQNAERQSRARQLYAERTNYGDMTNAPDFEEYASKGAKTDSTLLKKAKSINFNDFKYRTLNDKEVATYNYVLGKYGEDDADRYLDSISDQLAQRLGGGMAEQVKDSPILPYIIGAGAGAEQFAQGIEQNFSSDALPTTTLQYAGADTRENLGDAGKTIYDVAQSAGYMAPLIGVSVATGGLGAPALIAEGAAALTMFGSAKGNAYKSALDQGYSKDQANTYSLLSGAAEAGLQFVLGGISKVGGKLTGGVANKLASNIDNALLKTASNLGVRMAGEGTEEYLQGILDPVIRNITLDESNEFDPLDPDALNSFVVGALTAGFLEGPTSISSQISNNKAGEAVSEARKTYELIDNALALDPDTKAYKMASSIGTATESKIGELLKQYISDGGDTSFMKKPTRNEQNLQQVIDQQFQVDENGEIAIPELPDINNLPELPPIDEQTQADIPVLPEIGAQGATDTHKTAISLAKAYEGTEFGDMLSEKTQAGAYDYSVEHNADKIDFSLKGIQSGVITPESYTSIYNPQNGDLRAYTTQDISNIMMLIENTPDLETKEQLSGALMDALSESGRKMQMARYLYKISPSAHLSAIEREIARFNAQEQKKFKDFEGVSLTQEERQEILNGKSVKERTATYQQAIDRMQRELPSTAWDKIDQIRKTSMLFNPRTQIRNIVGNAMYTVMNAIRRKVEAGLQQFTPKDQRAESFIIKPEYKKMVLNEWDLAKDAYKNYGRYNMDAKLGQGYTQAFKNNGIGKAINKVSEITGMALDIGDVVFGKHHYETALASYMQAQGLKKITGEARAYAMERALEATFRAESKAANAISQLIKKGGPVGKFVSVAMPFVKTPINIAKESFDYSPLGMGKSLIVDTIRVKKGDISATQYIHNLAKGVTGTAVSALGFMLAMGMLIPGVELTGAPPEDKKEREFLYAQGWKPYSLKIGDTFFPVSWAQPVATTMLMGVTLADTIGKDEDFQLVDATGLIGTFFDSIAEISPLAGLKDLFQYNDSFGEAAVGVAQDLITQFIPAIGRQVSRVVDPNEYDIYTGGPVEQLKNQAASTFGFANEADTAQKVDVWGQPKTQQGDLFDRFIQNMVSPTNISVLSQDAVNNELMRLYESTGDAKALPIVFNERELKSNDVKEIFGDAIKLTAKELQTLKEGIGQSSRIAVETYINSEQYKADDDKTRAKTINAMYDDIRSLYRQAKAQGIDLPSVIDQVDVQSQEYFLGESNYDSPIPDVSMLVPEYDYGVNNDVSDILFALYKDTGDKSFLLEPKDAFKYKGETYEYESDPRIEVFEGYGDLPGLNDIVNSAWFEQQGNKEKAKIIDNSVDDILEALELSVVSRENPMAALLESEKVDTTAYERFNTPGWKEYSPDDKIVKQLDKLGVYPKAIDSFSAKNDLAQGTYTLTQADKKTLADMTYKELLKLGTLDAESAQQAIDKAYETFRNMIIERER